MGMLTHYRQLLKNFVRDDSGQNLIEYALVAALIALAAVSTMGTLANTLKNAFGKVTNELNSATGS